MKYKLIVLDVDGTLVNNQKQITASTAQAIKYAYDHDVIVTIASGRPISGLKEYFSYFEDVPFITYNGGVITDNNKKVIYEKLLHKNISDIIINFAKKNNANIIIWNNNELFVDEINDSILFYEKTSGKKAIIFSNEEFCKVNKIILYGKYNTLTEYKKELEEISQDIHCEFSSNNYLEFFDKEVSKGYALEFLCNYLNIKASECIAIGDNYNDLSMIEYAGVGVAMGNSPEEVKRSADFVTLTNEEDGVAYIINKLIYNK